MSTSQTGKWLVHSKNSQSPEILACITIKYLVAFCLVLLLISILKFIFIYLKSRVAEEGIKKHKWRGREGENNFSNEDLPPKH